MTIPCFILFGATGDLARRMLWPSLFHLHCEGLLPKDIRLIGTSRSDKTDDAFRDVVRKAVDERGDQELVNGDLLSSFLAQISYVALDAGDSSGFRALADKIDTIVSKRDTERTFYLSTAPDYFKPICQGLDAAGLTGPASRVILEKPIGKDLASSREISDAVAKIFDEDQTFRIDHYLGKETVQNLIALRFANSLFEPVWNATAISHVEISVSETVGVEGRGYYDDAGALRDMMQNHILQLLALVAMEPPAQLDGAAVRNEKIKVLTSLRPLTPETVKKMTVPAQYQAGRVNGKDVVSYRDEEGIPENSLTETYVAIQAYIDNWRWKDVPFFLETGKSLGERRTEIIVHFKKVPHNIFAGAGNAARPNRLMINLQPEESIKLELMAKQPGLDGVTLQPVELNLSLTQAFDKHRRRIAYERLILDGLKGNATLFVRRDELEAAWRWIDGIHESWRIAKMSPYPYEAGTAGPEATSDMIRFWDLQTSR